MVCFACGESYNADDKEREPMEEVKPETRTPGDPKPPVLFEYVPDDSFRGRGIAGKSWELYGVSCTEDDAKAAFPYYSYEGELVATKIKEVRTAAAGEDSERTRAKGYGFTGVGQRAGLFGHTLFKGAMRKAVTVTEGEEDAIAAYQMMGSNPSYACVSIKNGASAAKNLSKEDVDWLNQFDKIVVCFDSDEPGRKASKAFASLFSVDKVKIVDLDLKDANEYLKAGRNKEFMSLWYKAKAYRPEKLLYSSETRSLITEDNPKPIALYPFECMNETSWGIFSSSLIVLTGGTGSGKSAYLKSFLLHLFNTTSEKFGCIFLEESVKKSLYKFIAQDIKINIGNPKIYDTTPKEKILESWENLFAGDRFMFMNHFGSINIDIVLEQVRFLSASFGAKYIALDHVSIVVSSQEEGDERRNIDKVMTQLRTLAQELDIVIFVLCHLTRQSGSSSHEEGGRTSLSHLRGSGAIAQLADTAWGIERDSQDDDDVKKNVSTIRSLKQREAGTAGISGYVHWDNDTCEFKELDPEVMEEMMEDIRKTALVNSLGGPDVAISTDDTPIIMDTRYGK